MNYSDPISTKMCRLWISQILLHNENANIYIYHDGVLGRNNEILRSLKDYKKYSITLVKGDYAINSNIEFLNHPNISFKLYNLSKFDKPFIYLDADAIPLSNLDLMWDIRNEKPWVLVNHQRIKKHTDQFDFEFLNGGVQIVGDTSFCDFDSIVSSYNIKNMQIVTGHEQPLLYSYFRAIGYEYSHPAIGFGWNACSKFTKLEKKANRWTGRVFGLNPEGYVVNINHYWNKYKPWKINCPMYNEFK